MGLCCSSDPETYFRLAGLETREHFEKAIDFQRQNHLLSGLRVRGFANDDTMREVVQAFPQLRYLSLRASKAITDTTLKIIADNLPSLEVLDLRETKVSNAGLQHLAKLTNLKELYLADIRTIALAESNNDHLLAFLPHLTSLRILDLNLMKISDPNLQYIALLPSLEVLMMNRAVITDAGIQQHLSNTTSLREVYFIHTQVSNEGIKHLIKNRNLTAEGIHADRSLVTSEGREFFKK